MSAEEQLDPELGDLIDEHLSGLIDPARLERLDELLRGSEPGRRYFTRYSHLHTQLYFASRASSAAEKVLSRIEQGAAGMPPPAAASVHAPSRRRGPRGLAWLRRACSWLLVASTAVLAVLGVRSLMLREPGTGTPSRENAAWLVNARDCVWTDGQAPAAEMLPGRMLGLERGLAEIAFREGARVLLEGPASLEILSPACARLLRGRATARVPEPARGFTIVSPSGEVVDLGTEFGLSVADDGTTKVFVFEGKVEAAPRADGGAPASRVTLVDRQGAVLSRDRVEPWPGAGPADSIPFVREIAPPPDLIPRAFQLQFRAAAAGTILDAAGRGTGFTHRLPGTGAGLPAGDINLRLEPLAGHLQLTTTNSDLNTQFQLGHGEYLGVHLADLGFTGAEDFEVTASIPDIPKLDFVGQFGLYAGPASDRNIRGGLFSLREGDSYSVFLVKNNQGIDFDPYFVGLFSSGDDLRLVLRREGGKYSLTVENRAAGNSNTLAIRHPAFLDGEPDLYVGVFGANTQSELRRTLTIKEFGVTVWTAGR